MCLHLKSVLFKNNDLNYSTCSKILCTRTGDISSLATAKIGANFKGNREDSEGDLLFLLMNRSQNVCLRSPDSAASLLVTKGTVACLATVGNRMLGPIF